MQYLCKRLCKVKKPPKIPKKTWIDLTPPTHPRPKMFWKPITDMDRTLKSLYPTTFSNVYRQNTHGIILQWSAVAQLVECRTRNRESPGSNPRCYRFEVWAFSFTSRRLSRLSCINEYLAIDSGGNVSE